LITEELTERTATEGAGGAFLEAERLFRLHNAADPKVAASAWLETLAELLKGLRQSLVVMGSATGGAFQPYGIWPTDSRPSRPLMTAAENAIRGGRAVIEAVPAGRDTQAGTAIGYPIMVGGRVRGSVALELSEDADTRLALDHLAWGCGWMETIIRRRNEVPGDRLASAVELLATSVHHRRFQEATTAVATELAGLLHCERVSIGFLRGQHVKLRAISNSANFGKRAALVRALEAAMEEAVDQQATILFPAPETARPLVTRAHEALTHARTGGPICTIPLVEGQEVLGAVVLEKPEGESFDTPTVQLCEHVCALVGPVLEARRREDRWLTAKAADTARDHVSRLVGPGHVALKLSAAAAVLALVFLWFAKGDYRVVADATLEGVVQRAVSAPIAGYLAEANARAGDVVRKGQLLAMMDDRDLRLERLKWISQRAKQEREYTDAMSKHERAKAQILQTQIEQATAQIDLLDEQLSRLRILAPFDGYIITGDLSQALGAPLERGNVLFEVAPLNEYRVLLKVDERDVNVIKIGQRGELALTAAPDRALPIHINRITPISTAEEGRNFFRVDAGIDGEVPAGLRPGLQGVGKVMIDRRRYAWIWTHRITHWFRMTLWSWLP